MDRRASVVGTLNLLAAPLTAEAQPAGKTYRIGYLAGGPSGDFAQGLRELGWVVAKNIEISS
jgi:hypothetical protein